MMFLSIWNRRNLCVKWHEVPLQYTCVRACVRACVCSSGWWEHSRPAGDLSDTPLPTTLQRRHWKHRLEPQASQYTQPARLNGHNSLCSLGLTITLTFYEPADLWHWSSATFGKLCPVVWTFLQSLLNNSVLFVTGGKLLVALKLQKEVGLHIVWQCTLFWVIVIICYCLLLLLLLLLLLVCVYVCV